MKIKFGAIVTDGRGKIGGHVASKNRGGAYLRTKVTPSNPQTSYQMIARSLLASLSQSWSSLTEEQRLAWNNAVSDWTSTDIFGDIKKPSGLNLYVKLNANLTSNGGVSLLVPPAKADMPSEVVDTATYDISTGVLVITLAGSSADTVNAIVRATAPMSAGISYVKNQLRVIGMNAISGNTVTLTGNYAVKFGDPSVDANIYVSVQYLLDNGQKSTEQKVKVVVSA